MADIEFHTEKRGGYDEWSDPWRQVVEVQINGSTVPQFPEQGEFETTDGRPLDVEFPGRPHDACSVEIYDPTYVGWNVSRSTLEDVLVGERTIDIEQLGPADYGDESDVLDGEQDG